MGSFLRHPASLPLLAIALAGVPGASVVGAQEPPAYLRDRGPGVATSMVGTFVQEGELLVYPFFEWYADRNLEYKPSEMGYGLFVDYRGRYRASEGLIFVSYGLTRNLAVEVEAAVITARLEKSALDSSAMPASVRESGLGDVEAQLRWRFLEETERHVEGFAFFETVFPLQTTRKLIGTSHWEYKLGFGMTRGFPWGTLTARAAVEYTTGDFGQRQFDAGEYAIGYLKRLSPRWRVAAVIEGNQVDEIALITEIQWHLHRRAFLKVNNSWGLTPNATDFAPEIGLMMSF